MYLTAQSGGGFGGLAAAAAPRGSGGDGDGTHRTSAVHLREKRVREEVVEEEEVVVGGGGGEKLLTQQKTHVRDSPRLLRPTAFARLPFPRFSKGEGGKKRGEKKVLSRDSEE